MHKSVDWAHFRMCYGRFSKKSSSAITIQNDVWRILFLFFIALKIFFFIFAPGNVVFSIRKFKVTQCLLHKFLDIGCMQRNVAITRGKRMWRMNKWWNVRENLKWIQQLSRSQSVLLSRSVVRDKSNKSQEVVSAVGIFLHLLIHPKNIWLINWIPLRWVLDHEVSCSKHFQNK